MGPRPRKSSGTAAAPAQPALPPFHYTTSSSPPSQQPIANMSPAANSSGKTTSSSKAAKSKVAVLKLSPKALAKFPHEQQAAVKDEAASSASPSNANSSESKKDVATAGSETPAPSNAAAAPTPNGAESNAASTPAPSNGMLAPPANASKRKGVPGPKPGMKRTASQLDASGTPKPRGKPGPKKKQRVGENGEVLPNSTTAAPKLGPKANAGAINACLRALDRTGTPCRKWTKKSFAVRSFTGYSWGAGAYAALRQANGGSFPGDVTSDTSSTGEGSKDKPAQDSSAVMSEKSSADVDTPMQVNGAVASPAVAAAS